MSSHELGESTTEDIYFSKLLFNCLNTSHDVFG